MDIPILGQRPAVPEQVEACASFARKLNLANYGGPAYESVDFFASRKISCARDDVAWVTAELREECVTEVTEAAREFVANMKNKMAEGQKRRTG